MLKTNIVRESNKSNNYNMKDLNKVNDDLIKVLEEKIKLLEDKSETQKQFIDLLLSKPKEIVYIPQYIQPVYTPPINPYYPPYTITC